ncbi:MAG TPA: aminotransferase class IV [Chitinophagaceae bacterium]|nr:aminotransferase class IV [Chitinophagaceae bacterium]
MDLFFTYNDKIYKSGTAVITPDNRSLRYGDGIFETLKVHKGIIQLRDYHFERLFSGMETLQFEKPKNFTAAYLEHKILELCKKNLYNSFARVRLMIFRGNGGLYEAENHLPNYIIQTWSIENNDELNSNGLTIDVYPDAKKSCDSLANLKSNNHLPYIMAALHAKKLKVNDCILLNNHDRVCDTTIANIFIIKDEAIYTPSLSEGCIAGVMRRFVIEKLKLSSGFKVIEKPISLEDMQNADEVFLTNAIKGIRWVKQFKNIEYKNKVIQDMYYFLNN